MNYIKFLNFYIIVIKPFYFAFTDDFNQDTDDAESEGKSNILISLMQQHRKVKRNTKVKSLQIGFFVYKVGLYGYFVFSQYLTLCHFFYCSICLV